MYLTCVATSGKLNPIRLSAFRAKQVTVPCIYHLKVQLMSVVVALVLGTTFRLDGERIDERHAREPFRSRGQPDKLHCFA